MFLHPYLSSWYERTHHVVCLDVHMYEHQNNLFVLAISLLAIFRNDIHHSMSIQHSNMVQEYHRLQQQQLHCAIRLVLLEFYPGRNHLRSDSVSLDYFRKRSEEHTSELQSRGIIDGP